MVDIQKRLSDLLALVREADAAIMDIYNNAHSATVTMKSNHTPLTQADIASHRILTQGLTKLFPDTPIISEEGDKRENTTIVKMRRFWLIDPIDGTTDFLKRNGEFAVCVALIEGDEPVFGIVSAPALGVVYYGGAQMGSFRQRDGEAAQQIHVAQNKLGVIMGSRSHTAADTEQYLNEHYAGYERKTVGSMLKFTYVAEGLADVYLRLNTTMGLWDVAAGHAIVVGAGGTVRRPDGSPIDYHAASLLVGDFVASSS